MAESKTIQVPMEIQPPAQRQERERPEWARKSLHRVRMSQSIANSQPQTELAPEWVNNGPNAELRWREVERRAESEATSPPQYQQHATQGVYMENQSDNQQPQAQPPNPLDYDHYEPGEAARFQADNAAYMQSQIDARVQAHLTPHMGAMREAQIQRDYNAAVERYGDDANFQEVMHVALENCVEADKAGKKFDIVAEYQKANDASGARPGQRGNAHLPEQLRKGKQAVASLGRIIEHNHQTGRARPFGGRNWKG